MTLDTLGDEKKPQSNLKFEHEPLSLYELFVVSFGLVKTWLLTLGSAGYAFFRRAQRIRLHAVYSRMKKEKKGTILISNDGY